MELFDVATKKVIQQIKCFCNLNIDYKSIYYM